MMKFRSYCPITRGLDVYGDKWTLLILREIIFHEHTTFKELSQMPERIATNTLANRLEKLTTLGLLTKTVSKRNKLVFYYHATPKAVELMKVIASLVPWSEKHLYTKKELKDSSKLIDALKESPNFPTL